MIGKLYSDFVANKQYITQQRLKLDTIGNILLFKNHNSCYFEE
jgi:hypothetical protein